METIKSLKGIAFEVLYLAFKKAFADYEMQLTKAELEKMLARRGFVPELSFGAFNGEELVAFTFNGIGNFNGIKTAYDTGTGTIKEARGKGLAGRIFEYSLPYLKEASIEQYLLEVLQHNKTAVSVYSKIGFKVVREFYYFVSDINAINIKIKPLPEKIDIKTIGIKDLKGIESFYDFDPSWQNSFEAIKRSINDFIIIGAYDSCKLVAYIIMEPNTGDITQFVVAHNYRRKGIGSVLFKKAIAKIKYPTIKLINSDTKCSSILAFLNAHGIQENGKQFEMIKVL